MKAVASDSIAVGMNVRHCKPTEHSTIVTALHTKVHKFINQNMAEGTMVKVAATATAAAAHRCEIVKREMCKQQRNYI